MNPSIITADDHPFLLKGLNDFLIENKYNILDSAQDGNTAYNLIVKHKHNGPNIPRFLKFLFVRHKHNDPKIMKFLKV